MSVCETLAQPEQEYMGVDVSAAAFDSLERAMAIRFGQAPTFFCVDEETAKRRLCGVAQLVMTRQVSTSASFSPMLEEAVDFVMALDEFDRCDYVMSVCEQLHVHAKARYQSAFGDVSEVVILCAESSEKTCWRVLNSDFFPLSPDELALYNRSFSRFLENLAPEFNFSAFTAYVVRQLEIGGDEYLRDLLRAAFESTSPRVLSWLCRDGLYNGRWNSQSTLVTCGNPFGLALLISEGFDLNLPNEYGALPLSCGARTAEMVDALVAAGAKIELLSSDDVPSPVALRRMLQLKPDAIKSKIGWDLLISGTIRHDPVLQLIEAISGFGYPTPSESEVHLATDAMTWALFTFGFTRKRPRSDLYGGNVWFYWRPHCHYVCDSATKECVFVAMLCFKRVCRTLPRDMRNLLLTESFGRSPKMLASRVHVDDEADAMFDSDI